jgi:methyl-accepting chemotaxis protein
MKGDKSMRITIVILVLMLCFVASINAEATNDDLLNLISKLNDAVKQLANANIGIVDELVKFSKDVKLKIQLIQLSIEALAKSEQDMLKVAETIHESLGLINQRLDDLDRKVNNIATILEEGR